MGVSDWIKRLQSVVASTKLLQTTVVHAARRLPGFGFDETMVGTVSLTGPELPVGELPIKLDLHARAESLGDYLSDGRTVLTGTVTIDGVVRDEPIHGSLFIWPHRRVIRYELAFSVAGRELQLAGQKDVRLLDFSHTMTTLPAKIFDARGSEIGHTTVVFNWADLPAFVRSFRQLRDKPAHAPA